MWIRSCAVCKALLIKLRLCDSVAVGAAGNGSPIPAHSVRNHMSSETALTLEDKLEQ